MRKAYLAVVVLILAFSSNGFGQEKSKDKSKKKEFCSESKGWSGNYRVSSNDLRESTTAAGGVVNVQSGNGRITVVGESRSDVKIRACVRAWAATKAEADAKVKAITIANSPVIKAENTPEKNWSVSYIIHVPNSSNLDLNSKNGRISIDSVSGQLKFRTSNGRITLNKVSGDVKGETNNGRVTVKLSGATWQGSGLDVRTSNGRISLYLPRNYRANVSAGTNNGRFSSDFAELKIDKKKKRWGPKNVSAAINGGGAPIKMRTNNGRISIHAAGSGAL